MLSYLVFFSFILLTRNHITFLVQFGINEHLLIFSNTANSLALRARYLFQIALEMTTLFHTQLIFLEDCEQF